MAVCEAEIRGEGARGEEMRAKRRGEAALLTTGRPGTALSE